jgi:hypothetical protein
MIILIDQNIETILSKVFNFKFVYLLSCINERYLSSCLVVNAEVVEVPPGIYRRLTAEAIVLIFKPYICKSNRGKSLVFCFFGHRLVSKKLFLILLDERSIENAGLKSVI